MSHVQYSDEIANRICGEIAEGRSLRSVCLEDWAPNQRTVFRWLADEERENFRQQYARAREAQADAIFDEILDIADDGTNDWVERRRDDGSVDTAFDHEHVQRSKLRIEARRWMAGKLRPKVYGDKIEHEHSGSIAITVSDEDAGL